ncbi:MAG: hypothetical protein ACREIF_08195 [Chthoniobacterales bacterium]
MPKRDVNQEALRQVSEVTESGKPQIDELLRSPKLREQLREAEERQRKSKSEPGGQKPI